MARKPGHPRYIRGLGPPIFLDPTYAGLPTTPEGLHPGYDPWADDRRFTLAIAEELAAAAESTGNGLSPNGQRAVMLLRMIWRRAGRPKWTAKTAFAAAALDFPKETVLQVGESTARKYWRLAQAD